MSAAVRPTSASYDAVPAELRARAQWVVWRVETRDGKPTKVPYQPRRPGTRASSTDAASWGTFDDAVRAAARDRTIAGVGFVFAREGGYVGVDLDKCRDPQTGALEPWAADVVRALDSYAEVSPSGTGVHVLVRGALPPGGNRKGRVEMYAEGRYFTITGQALPHTPTVIAERTAQLARVHADHIGSPALFTKDATNVDTVAEVPAHRTALSLPDAEVLERAMRAQNGDKLRTLYEWGDLAAYDGDRSRADAALVALLAFYTRDPAQLDRLYRGSALMRAKWDERRGQTTYGERTIASALATVRETASAPSIMPVLPDDAARVASPASVLAMSSSAATTPRASDPGSATPSAPEGMPEPVCALDAPEPEPVAWLVDELWTAGDLGLLVAPDGVMKTTVALHLACAIAGGKPAFGRFATQRRSVLFVSGEDPLPVLVNRAEAIVRGQGWSRSEVLGNLHILALAGVDMADPRWAAHLTAIVTRLDAGFVVLDPLAELATGEENDNTQRRALVQACRRLTVPTGAAVMLVHHFGKAGDSDRPKRERIRGASAVAAASRCTYTIEPRDGELQIECLKLSRGARPPSFVVRHEIVAVPDNRLVWQSARFSYENLRVAALGRAEAYIVGHLEDGVELTSTDLRATAKGSGISNEEIARALRVLELRRLIVHRDGPRGAKYWRLASPPAHPPNDGAPNNFYPADLAGTLPGQGRPDLAYGPKDLGQGQAGAATLPWHPADEEPDADDAAYLADERAALAEGL